MNYWILI